MVEERDHCWRRHHHAVGRHPERQPRLIRVQFAFLEAVGAGGVKKREVAGSNQTSLECAREISKAVI